MTPALVTGVLHLPLYILCIWKSIVIQRSRRDAATAPYTYLCNYRFYIAARTVRKGKLRGTRYSPKLLNPLVDLSTFEGQVEIQEISIGTQMSGLELPLEHQRAPLGTRKAVVVYARATFIHGWTQERTGD